MLDHSWAPARTVCMTGCMLHDRAPHVTWSLSSNGHWHSCELNPRTPAATQARDSDVLDSAAADPAVEQLKAICPDEAKGVRVALDITAKLGELALQHRGSSSSRVQHPKPNAVVESSSDSDPPYSGDDVEKS
jgi:hypothetical protein